MQNQISTKKGISGDDLGKLTAFFPEDCISWVPWSTGTNQEGVYWVKLIPQLGGTAIMNRLDKVCRPQNWQDYYDKGPNGGVICKLSILIEGEWITKIDGVDNPRNNPVKIGMREAFIRAAAKWGIGRYVYSIRNIKGIVSRDGRNSVSYPLYPKKNERVVYFRYDVLPMNSFWLPGKESETEEVKKIRKGIEPLISGLNEKARLFFEAKLAKAISPLEARRIAAAFQVSYDSQKLKESGPKSEQEYIQEDPPEQEKEVSRVNNSDENEFV